jgi:hypothetical protein
VSSPEPPPITTGRWVLIGPAVSLRSLRNAEMRLMRTGRWLQRTVLLVTGTQSWANELNGRVGLSSPALSVTSIASANSRMLSELVSRSLPR